MPSMISNKSNANLCTINELYALTMVQIMWEIVQNWNNLYNHLDAYTTEQCAKEYAKSKIKKSRYIEKDAYECNASRTTKMI